jgi:hypothetical protein
MVTSQSEQAELNRPPRRGVPSPFWCPEGGIDHRRRIVRAVTRLARAVAVLVTLASLLSLSACGSSVPSAVGSYRATFVYAPTSVDANDFVVGNANSVFALVISADGHFVMTSRGHQGTVFHGTWSQAKSAVTLSETRGTNKVEFVARQEGKNLRQGHIEYLSRPAPVGYTLPWYAVRT